MSSNANTAPHLTAAYYDSELDGEVIPLLAPWNHEAREWLTDYLIKAGVSPLDIVSAKAYDADHGTRFLEDMLTWAAVDSLRDAHAVLDDYEAFTKTSATLGERRRRSHEVTERLRELGGEGFQPGRSYLWRRCDNIERASGYEPAFLHFTPLELKHYAERGLTWSELRRDLLRTGMLHARAEHLRAVERYLYRASMRARAGGLGEAIHGPPSPDDFGIPTAHLVTATVAPSHAGPLAR